MKTVSLWTELAIVSWTGRLIQVQMKAVRMQPVCNLLQACTKQVRTEAGTACSNSICAELNRILSHTTDLECNLEFPLLWPEAINKSVHHGQQTSKTWY
jgi:hypothetical protein